MKKIIERRKKSTAVILFMCSLFNTKKNPWVSIQEPLNEILCVDYGIEDDSSFAVFVYNSRHANL
jgi:hypothetical protein